MPVRYIKETICTSDNVDQLTPFQETVFVRLIVNCDDYGRFDGRPKVMASRLFPLRDIPVADMEEAIKAMQDADLITVYTVNGRPYLQMNTWSRHQSTRAKNSKYPGPDEETCETMHTDVDGCMQAQTDADRCPRNRISYIEYRISESESESVTDAEAAEIQNEHNQVLDAAQNAGFKSSPAERAGLLNLYSQYGLDKLLNGINECMTHSAPTMAYLTAVLKGGGKKQKTDARDVHGYEQRDYSKEQAKAVERMMRDDFWPEDDKKGGTG